MQHFVFKTISSPSKEQLQDSAEQISAINVIPLLRDSDIERVKRDIERRFAK